MKIFFVIAALLAHLSHATGLNNGINSNQDSQDSASFPPKVKIDCDRILVDFIPVKERMNLLGFRPVERILDFDAYDYRLESDIRISQAAKHNGDPEAITYTIEVAMGIMDRIGGSAETQKIHYYVTRTFPRTFDDPALAGSEEVRNAIADFSADVAEREFFSKICKPAVHEPILPKPRQPKPTPSKPSEPKPEETGET